MRRSQFVLVELLATRSLLIVRIETGNALGGRLCEARRRGRWTSNVESGKASRLMAVFNLSLPAEGREFSFLATGWRLRTRCQTCRTDQTKDEPGWSA
jgi:hypothetical protein